MATAADIVAFAQVVAVQPLSEVVLKSGEARFLHGGFPISARPRAAGVHAVSFELALVNWLRISRT